MQRSYRLVVEMFNICPIPKLTHQPLQHLICSRIQSWSLVLTSEERLCMIVLKEKNLFIKNVSILITIFAVSEIPWTSIPAIKEDDVTKILSVIGPL